MELTDQQPWLRQNRAAMVLALQAKMQGNACRCPFHDDKHASAGIFTDDQGVWRFKCHGCMITGDIFDIRARMEGRPLGDVLKAERPESTRRKLKIYPTLEAVLASKTLIDDQWEPAFPIIEAVYRYENPDTDAIDLVVIRYSRAQGEKKQFAQCSPRDDGWIKTRPEGKLPLYNLKAVKAASVVVVVEGEKKAETLKALGIAATNSAMGAGKAKETDWSPLKGKTVYLWPDNDTPGEKHMNDVRQILEADCELFMIEPENLGIPVKGDVVDFLAANEGTLEDQVSAIGLVLDEARPLDAAQELEQRFHAIIEGGWKNIEWPWRTLTVETQALLPDTVTALCGDPGSGKSFLLLEAFWKWHCSGRKVAMFELEDDRVYHLQRVLAQLEGNSNLTNTEWVKNNPERARESYQNQKDIIASLGKVIWDAPDRQVTLPDLADWFETRSAEGYEISAIDPVTAAESNDKPWIADQNFIFRVKTTAKKYHTRLVYAIHPRIANGKTGPSLARMAGGAAYPRFSHTVLWLIRHDKEKRSEVWGAERGTRPVTHDRTLRMAKARNGRGAGQEIAMHLNTGSLCFDEYGLVSVVDSGVRENA